MKEQRCTDPRYIAAKKEITSHMEEAKSEFWNYKSIMKVPKESNTKNIRHFVFDFAENVLLPKLQKATRSVAFYYWAKV